MPPMVGAYERPLSLTTITRRRELSSLMLLSASQVMPAGERTVADDRDDVAVALTGHREGARDAVGPAQRARRVRALDDVVRGLRALRVAGEASLRAQPREVLAPGEQLVHVALVAGVEDDRVVRRVEHAVDRDRQLDDAEVRPEVPAGLRDLATRNSRISAGELLELRTGQPIEVAGTMDRLEQRSCFEPKPAACQTSERSTYCRMPPLR